MAAWAILAVAVLGASACASKARALPPEPKADQPPDACRMVATTQVEAATHTSSVTAPTRSALANTGFRVCEWSSRGTEVAAMTTSTTASIAALGCRCTSQSEPAGTPVAVAGDSARLWVAPEGTYVSVKIGSISFIVTVYLKNKPLAAAAAISLVRDAAAVLLRTS
jgi:hypothetical protein